MNKGKQNSLTEKSSEQLFFSKSSKGSSSPHTHLFWFDHFSLLGQACNLSLSRYVEPSNHGAVRLPS